MAGGLLCLDVLKTSKREREREGGEKKKIGSGGDKTTWPCLLLRGEIRRQKWFALPALSLKKSKREMRRRKQIWLALCLAVEAMQPQRGGKV
jgi:hypothetical protein